MAWGQITYQDSTRKESVLDLLTDVSSNDNPLATLLGTTRAGNTLHEFPEDYQARPTAVRAQPEGREYTFSDLTAPSRRVNFTQIIDATFRVSNTQRAIDHYGVSDPFEYQASKALFDLKNNLEYALVRGSGASGSSGVARQMIGIEAVTTSHYTARNSGTSLSEGEFNDALNDVWTDVGSQHTPDAVLAPMGLRRAISRFTGENTRYVDFNGKLDRVVDQYTSDTGVVNIFAHKDVSSSNATPGPALLGIKLDYWKIAYLREPERVELAKVGSDTRGAWELEASLEYRGERTSFRRTGYLTS